MTQVVAVEEVGGMAGLDEQSEEDMSRMAAECAVELYRGGWPEGRVVNPEVRPGWRWLL